jgi:hypothetical protein
VGPEVRNTTDQKKGQFAIKRLALWDNFSWLKENVFRALAFLATAVASEKCGEQNPYTRP